MSILDNPKKIFIIIPAYNEHKVIKTVIQELVTLKYNIVVIDDGSLINLQSFLNDFPIYVLRHKINMGQGAAIQTGIKFAISKSATFIVTFDADGQHQPSDILSLLLPLQNNDADITLGSRFLTNSSFIPSNRKKILQLARFINYLFTGILLTDAHNGLRAMSLEAAGKLRIRQNGMAHATEIINEIRKKGLRFKEIPVKIRYTEYSKQKGQTAWNSFRILLDVILNKFLK